MIDINNIAQRTKLLAGMVWLFHVSAIIGVSIGYENWFIERTPLNLMIIAGSLMLAVPLNQVRMFAGLLLFMGAGMFSEYLGVQYGLVFGEYTYGENLGPKLAGVPYLIGLNWAVLVIITASISGKLSTNPWIRAALGSSLMVVLDLVMEPVSPIFDFWEFAGGVAPLQNYIGWFAVGFLLQLLYPYFFKRMNRTMAMHLFLAQFIFFTYFSLWYTFVA